ncbi:MAG: amidohydrolase family protein [Pseudomonadota bacterium]
MRVFWFSLAISLALVIWPSASFAQDGKSILIENATVIPMDREVRLSNHDVLVRDGRIVAMAGHGTLAVAGAVDRYDATGLFLIPGLWESHAHITVTDFRQSDPRDAAAKQRAIQARTVRRLQTLLSAGVTSVRDLGMAEDVIPIARALRDRVDLPALRFAGPVINGTRTRWSSDVEANVERPDAALALVDRLADGGVDFVKIYDGITPALYAVLTERARDRGLPIAGHIPHNISTAAAIEGGMTSIQHTYLDAVKDCTTLGNAAPFAPLTAWMEGGYGARWKTSSDIYRGRDVAACRALHRRMGELGVFIVATPQMDLPLDMMVDAEQLAALPPAARESCQTTLADHRTVGADVRERRAADLMELYGDLRAAGVRLVAGSDAPNDCMGFRRSLAASVQLFGDLGLTRFVALRTATGNAAAMAGVVDEGMIVTGAAANLVLLGADPLNDLAALHDVRAVMLRGDWATGDVVDGEDRRPPE